MSNFLQFILVVTIIIISTKTGGYLSIKLKQPAVVGELLAGIALGPTLLDVMHWSIFTDHHLPEFVNHLGEFGVILLMLLAGMHLHIDDLIESSKIASLAGTLGVITPLLMVWGVCILFNMPTYAAIFVGLIMAATSVSISAQTLMEMGMLRSKVGITMMGAAVIDDILVLLGLSIFTALATSTNAISFAQIATIVLQMIGYFIISVAIGMLLIPRITNWIDKLPIYQGIYLFTLVITLIYAWTAEVIGGVAAITGAFLVGLFLGKTKQHERIIQGMSTIAYGMFVPIFFANIGLQSNARDISGNLIWITAAIIIVAILSKLIGCSLGARMGGMNTQDSLQVGAGMISRGEVGLIVASLGLSHKIINQEIFSITVVTVIVVTLVTPLIMYRLSKETTTKDSVTT
ncbi:MAG TPA: cation:proton antiporter [Chloroflexi bacterium]|nr:cation:proton antiporter [Chloroflexota bacterium]